MSASRPCPDCESRAGFDRRDFLKASAAGLALPALAGSVSWLQAEDKAATTPETRVAQLYKSLSDEQRKLCSYAFDHPLRQDVNNNWFINESRIGKHFTGEQQKLIEEIFLNLHSPEYAAQVMEQVDHDGGFHDCAVALFGEPGTGKFEFVLTGRHVTRRCDGDSVAGAAFGGPIFYGHAAQAFNEAPDHAGNIYWYQAKRANELFQALSGKQREVALLGTGRPEKGTETVKLAGQGQELPGLPFGELTSDQKTLAKKVMSDLLAPFRDVDRAESMKLIEANGFDSVHLSYYKNQDIGNDGVWDVWMLEGPAMVWYFRGAPHVHTWVHIRDKA
ncbi:MAG: DUF3500 domain-containing protein [Pirellulaceae bacterium]